MTVDDLKAILAASVTKIVDITQTVDVGELDHLDLDGHDVRSTADPMFRIIGSHWSIRNGRIRAEVGVTIDLVESSLGLVSGVWLESGHPGKEVVRCVGSGFCYDTLFQACELAKPPNMTVPIVRVSVDGAFYNSNAWNQIRFQTNGTPAAPCVVIECLETSNWIYGNSFTNINGEQPNAGLIHCGGCYGTVMQNITVYDTHVSGNITDNLIWLGKASVPGLRCINTTVRNYSRLSGDLVEGKYDVHFYDHYAAAMLLEQISGTGSRLRVKCPLSATRIEVQEFNDPWRNA